MVAMIDERNPLWARVDAVVAAGLVTNERQWLLDAKLSTGFFSSKRAEEKKKGRHIGLQADNLQRLAAVAGVNAAWLQSGAGPMRAGGDPEVQDGPLHSPSITRVGQCAFSSISKSADSFRNNLIFPPPLFDRSIFTCVVFYIM